MNKIEIVRGTTLPINITVMDESNKLRSLADGEKIIFGIKRKESDKDPIFSKVATKDIDGTFNVTITPDDTANLDYGKYFYDVSLQSGENFFNIIEASPFIIRINVTYRGCAD